jgi:Na+/H+ antiporter NhaB
MKIYEYKNGKTTKKTFKEYLKNKNANYLLLRDLHILFTAISLVFVLLPITIAFSVVSVIFYSTSIFLSIFIDAIAVISSVYSIIFFWSRYKKDLLKSKSG